MATIAELQAQLSAAQAELPAASTALVSAKNAAKLATDDLAAATVARRVANSAKNANPSDPSLIAAYNAAFAAYDAAKERADIAQAAADAADTVYSDANSKIVKLQDQLAQAQVAENAKNPQPAPPAENAPTTTTATPADPAAAPVTVGPAVPLTSKEVNNVEGNASSAAAGAATNVAQQAAAMNPLADKGISSGGVSVPQTIPFDASAEQKSLSKISPVASPSDDAKSYKDKPAAAVTAATAMANQKYTTSVNILHDYATYTYSLSLHALSKEDYNKIHDSGQYTPTNILIASAGRVDPSFPRNQYFSEDFFFEKLSMTTIIGQTSQSRNSNAIDFRFSIIEPYGMTLLNRIIMASDKVNAKNFREMPYLIQIDFYGTADDGDLAGVPVKIPLITKYLPIRFNEFKMKVSTQGAHYDISASPYNHEGFSESVGTVPFKLEVNSGSVGEFFTTSPEDIAAFNSALASKKVTDAKKVELENTLKVERASQASSFSDSRQKQITADETNLKSLQAAEKITVTGLKSFTGALEAWWKRMKDDKIVDSVDRFIFKIHPDLKDSKFPDRSYIGKDTVSMEKPSDIGVQQTSATKIESRGKNTAKISINQGMSILEIIGMVVRNSEYIIEQGSDPNRGKTSPPDTPLKWFKIVPELQLGDWDAPRKKYSKIFTYSVAPYTYYNTKHDLFPDGKPDGWVKDYQYIFTGKNRDIITFDMVFDTTYYCVKTAFAINKETDQVAKDARPADDKQVVVPANTAVTNKEKAVPLQSTHMDEMKVYAAATTGSAELASNSNQDQPAQVQKDMMNGPSGDMITVKLKIVGDPDFIKQDDIFYGREDTQIIDQLDNAKTPVTPNRSIITDRGEIFVNLTFYTPSDYSDDTGLMIPQSGPYTASVFSGYYRVIKVESTFTNGKFEQELELCRYPNQKSPGIDAAPADSSAATQRDILSPASSADTRTTSAPPLPNVEQAQSTSNTFDDKKLPADANVPRPTFDASADQKGNQLADGAPGKPINVDASAGAIGSSASPPRNPSAYTAPLDGITSSTPTTSITTPSPDGQVAVPPTTSTTPPADAPQAPGQTTADANAEYLTKKAAAQQTVLAAEKRVNELIYSIKDAGASMKAAENALIASNPAAGDFSESQLRAASPAYAAAADQVSSIRSEIYSQYDQMNQAASSLYPLPAGVTVGSTTTYVKGLYGTTPTIT